MGSITLCQVTGRIKHKCDNVCEERYVIVVSSVTDMCSLVPSELVVRLTLEKEETQRVSLKGLRVRLGATHYAVGSFFFARHLSTGLRAMCLINTFLFCPQSYLAGLLCTERLLN